MAPDERPAGRRRALLIATATYGDPGLASLRAPTGDVAALAQVLGDGAIGGFDVRQLIDEPTEDLRKEIETFFGDGRPQDLLLLYVSGHGVLSQSRRFYFATSSTSLQLLRSTAIEDSFVNDVMQASRARSIVLVLDCCHSGAFGKGLAPKSAMTVDVEHRFEGQGRVTLSASTELEYAFEEAGPDGINELEPAAPGSLFTRSVVEGLQSGDADVDEDGSISVDDLYDYVCRRVRERSVHQTPGMAGDIRGEIMIARSRRRAELPPELARAVASNLAGIREGAVAELKALIRAGGATAAAARAALERLGEDDSRRVATAALAALGRSPPVAAPPPPPVARRRRRPPRRLVLGVAGALVVVAVAVSVVSLLSGGGDGASGPSEATAYDFNGDGLQEIVAAPLKATTPEVLVTSPLDGFRPRSISAAEAKVDVGPDESFGTAIAGGDFDGDGKADLAIGTPDLNLVSVLYGSGDLGFPHVVVLTGPDASRFGQALVARDLNADGRTDLVVGAEGAGASAGSLRILLGGPGDLTLKGARKITPPPGITDSFGAILSSGDLNGDGNMDVVEGAPDDSGQHLTYCLGAAHAPPARCAALKAPNLDSGTSALAVADLDNDDKDDIIQGDTHIGGPEHGGGLRIWKGHEGVPEGTPIPVDPEDVVTSHGMGAASSRFGAALDAGHLDDDEFADIVVGVPGFNGGEGAVAAIRGSAASIARNEGVPVESHFGFGADVALLELQSSGTPNLVIVSESAEADDVVRYSDSDGNAIKSVAGFEKLVQNRKQAKDLHIGHDAGTD